MRIHPFQASLPVLHQNAVDESLFDHFKNSFVHLRDSGAFRTLDQEGVFIYEIERHSRVFRGLIACIDVGDYLEGKIKKHEMTLLSKEQTQISLFETQQAIIKPVLATYPSDRVIQEWLEHLASATLPLQELTIFPAEETHRLFFIKEREQIEKIRGLFLENLRDIYIADGHHRFAAASRLFLEGSGHPFQQIMCAFFDADDLEIHSYNRVVSGLNGLSPKALLQRINRYCEVTQLEQPEPPAITHSMLLLLGQEYYSLRWHSELLQQYGDSPLLLDVQLLNEKILGEILGIEDVRKDPRIIYKEGPAGLEALQKCVLEAADCAAFMLYPISFAQLTALSDEGIMLPPKSTWFEPRMKTGLIACSLQASKKGSYA